MWWNTKTASYYVVNTIIQLPATGCEDGTDSHFFCVWIMNFLYPINAYQCHHLYSKYISLSNRMQMNQLAYQMLVELNPVL